MKNCSLLGTDNVRGQISEPLFAPKEIIIMPDRHGLAARELGMAFSKKYGNIDEASTI